MGKYTEPDDAAVEAAVDDILTDITDRLVFHFHPRSIILTGSFGRGEATIINPGGNLNFLSDCEVVLAGNRYFSSRRIVETLGSALTEGNKPQFVIRSSIALPVYPLLPLSSVLWKPSIWNYDLKYGARNLYGVDYLAKMPGFDPRQIPAWEGVRLIFNRLAEALRYFPLPTGAATPEQGPATAFWVTKIILACQDGLLIGGGKYHVSCRARNRLFQETAGQNFKELIARLPGFTALAAKATDYKLTREVYWTDIRDLWFDAAEICDPVLRYLLREHMRIDFGSYLELKDKYLRHPVVRSVMALGRTFSKKSLVLSLPSVLRSGGPWVHLLYPAIAQVYFSLSRNGAVDRSLLESARKTLSLFSPMAPARDDPSEEWHYLKGETHNLWYALGS